MRDVAPAINIPAALLTVYLVITSLMTVRPRAGESRWLDVGAMLVALAVGLISLTFGFEALANGGQRNGMPAFPFFMFGVGGLLASIGDLRMMRSGVLKGVRLFPNPIRIPPRLALPVLAVLVTMFHWLWRVRIRRSVRGIVGVSAPEAV